MPLLRKHSTVSGDTHALANGGGANEESDIGIDDTMDGVGTFLQDGTEQVVASVAITVANAVNKVVVVGVGVFSNRSGADRSSTVRIRQTNVSGTILATRTVDITQDDTEGLTAAAVLDNVATGAKTYVVTAQTVAAATMGIIGGGISAREIGLTGSQGVCTP